MNHNRFDPYSAISAYSNSDISRGKSMYSAATVGLSEKLRERLSYSQLSKHGYSNYDSVSKKDRPSSLMDSPYEPSLGPAFEHLCVQ